MSFQNDYIKNDEFPKISKTNRNLTIPNEKNPKENQSKKVDINNIPRNKIIKNKNEFKKKLIILCFIFLLTATAIILLIGYFALDWFRKKQDLIVEMKRDENLVMRYLEVKKVRNYYDIEGLLEEEKKQDDSIVTDLIVGINKKTKTSYIGDIDYIYEAYLLIINMSKINETNIDNLGGLNIYDESKSIDELIIKNNDLFFININNNTSNNISNNISHIPFCKFYFYENGTIGDVFFPNNNNEFYKSALSDLIEKIIPKLSSSLYNLKDNKRKLENGESGIYLDYEKNDKNGEMINTTLYEKKLEKNIDNENNFESNELNSNIKRIFNSSGDMIYLEMKGEALFKGHQKENENKIKNVQISNNEKEKIIKTNISFYNLGYNQFKMNVSSKMELLETQIDIHILNNLNKLSKKFQFEKYLTSNIISKEKEDSNENLNNYNEINKNRKLLNEQNNSDCYQLTYNLMTTSFLGINIGLDQGLYINNKTGLRKGHIDTNIGGKKYILSNLDYYYNPLENKNGSISKKLIDKEIEGLNKNFNIFGFLINADLNLNFNANHGISYEILNGELYTKSFSDFDVNVEGTFGPKFIVFSFGVVLTGHIVTGEAYIQANTLINRIEYYKKINSCAVDISFYFSVYILFYEKKYSKDIRLYEGFSSYENYYKDI